jgi:hypothetical protein
MTSLTELVTKEAGLKEELAAVQAKPELRNVD